MQLDLLFVYITLNFHKIGIDVAEYWKELIGWNAKVHFLTLSVRGPTLDDRIGRL